MICNCVHRESFSFGKVPAGLVCGDVAGRKPDFNRYSYAWNNPLKYIDPSGYNNIRLDENTTAIPYIAGSGGYLNNWNYITSGIGPGSGNHWSDQNRSEWGNFMLGNSRSFDGMYGQGAWNNFYTSMFTKQATNGRVNSTMINDRTSISMVVGWMSAGFNISVVNAFGNSVLVGSFGALGTMRYGEGGGLIFSNKTAGMVKGEGVVSGAIGGGGVSFEHAKLWYQFGGGARMDVDLNSINLSKVRITDFNSRGLATVQLAGKHFTNLNDALVHGTITLQRIGNTNQARLALNSDPYTPQINGQPAGMYDFEMHSWGVAKNWVRNPEAFIGGITNGLFPIGGTCLYLGGTPYPIYYNGIVTIQP